MRPGIRSLDHLTEDRFRSGYTLISMRVLLIGNFLPDQLQSMKRFCDLMEEGLVKAGHRVQVLRPKPFFYRLWNRHSTLQKWLGYLDKFVLFPIS